MDLIGCKTEPKDFVTAGTCEDQLYGKDMARNFVLNYDRCRNAAVLDLFNLL